MLLQYRKIRTFHTLKFNFKYINDILICDKMHTLHVHVYVFIPVGQSHTCTHATVQDVCECKSNCLKTILSFSVLRELYRMHGQMLPGWLCTTLGFYTTHTQSFPSMCSSFDQAKWHSTDPLSPCKNSHEQHRWMSSLSRFLGRVYTHSHKHAHFAYSTCLPLCVAFNMLSGLNRGANPPFLWVKVSVLKRIGAFHSTTRSTRWLDEQYLWYTLFHYCLMGNNVSRQKRWQFVSDMFTEGNGHNRSIHLKKKVRTEKDKDIFITKKNNAEQKHIKPTKRIKCVSYLQSRKPQRG